MDISPDWLGIRGGPGAETSLVTCKDATIDTSRQSVSVGERLEREVVVELTRALVICVPARRSGGSGFPGDDTGFPGDDTDFGGG